MCSAKIGTAMTEPEVHFDKTPNDVTVRRFKPTLEFPIFLVMFGVCLSSSVITNILLHRTCINTLKYSKTECAVLLAPGPKSNETKRLENEVQQYTSIVRMIHSMIEALFPAILSLFLGVWSNTYGRKPLIVWPLFGMFVTSFFNIIYTAASGLSPWWFLVTAIPFSVTGGYSALFTGAFCYITDVTKQEDRSLRIILLEAALFTGTILGTLSSPYLLMLLEEVNLLLLASVIQLLAYVYTYTMIEESVKGATQGNLSSVFDLSLVKEMTKTCVKKRPNKDRTILILLITCCALSGIYASHLDYMYLRNKLEWSLETFSIYGAVHTLTMIVGLMLGVTFMQKVLKISDIYLSMLSYASSVTDYLFKVFAAATWHMYLGTSLSLFRGLAPPLIRSILSKMLPEEDFPKIISLLSVLGSVFPLFTPLIFNSLYSATINVFPGSIFVLLAAIYVLNFVILCVVKYIMWRYPSTLPYSKF